MAERELKRACGPFWPGGILGLEALRDCDNPPPQPPFGLIRKLFQPRFLLFDFFAYDTFFFYIHTGQTDRPIQFFLGQNV